MRWIADASEQVTDYLNRVVALEEVTETFLRPTYYDPMDDLVKALPLTRYPVTQIESITYDSDPLNPLDPTSYRVDLDAGLIYRELTTPWSPTSVWTWWGSSLVVQYWAGYPLLDGLPRAIEMAVLRLLQYRNAGVGGRDPTISLERTFDVQEVRYFDRGAVSASEFAIPAEVAVLLKPYRREYA
jgi:hypothetical protein